MSCSPDIIQSTKLYLPRQVKLALANGVNVNERDADGRTALMWAARNNFADIAELLLDHGADVDAKDKEGMTAARWAVFGITNRYGSREALGLLVARGADIENAQTHQTTILKYAKNSGWHDIVAIYEKTALNAELKTAAPSETDSLGL